MNLMKSSNPVLSEKMFARDQGLRTGNHDHQRYN
jgi:hypothetical protein